MYMVGAPCSQDTEAAHRELGFESFKVRVPLMGFVPQRGVSQLSLVGGQPRVTVGPILTDGESISAFMASSPLSWATADRIAREFDQQKIHCYVVFDPELT